MAVLIWGSTLIRENALLHIRFIKSAKLETWNGRISLVSHRFWRQFVTLLSHVNLSHYFTQIVQKTISKHHSLCECIKTSMFPCKSSMFAGHVNLFKFDLQYKWTSPQIFLCGYHILRLLCHNVEQKSWYQVKSKTAGAEIFLISETWF